LLRDTFCAGKVSTKKLWERKEAFIHHPINRDCETLIPPQGRAFALSARRRTCNGAESAALYQGTTLQGALKVNETNNLLNVLCELC
jgi:hypothetical protein